MSQRLSFEDQMRLKINKARREGDAEAESYYRFNLANSSACADFETFKKSWVYQEWRKKNIDGWPILN